MPTGRPAPSRPSRRSAAAALVATLLVLLLASAVPGWASPGQADPSTTPSTGPTISTTDDLLEGGTTVVPSTADAASTTLPPSAGSGSAAGDETRNVWLIVVALVLIALALSYLTWRYWQRTAPARPTPFDQDRADEPETEPERRPSAAR